MPWCRLFHRALTMPEEEQIAHMEVMQKSLQRYNIHHWVNMFMERLGEIKDGQAVINQVSGSRRLLTSLKRN